VKSSINIKYDISDAELLRSYFATSSHTGFIKGILNNSINHIGSSAHIAYGPYGSGKSYVATIIAKILSKQFNEENLDVLAQKYSVVDEAISSLFNQAKDSPMIYLPVILTGGTGNPGDFEKNIIKAIKTTLSDYNITITYPGIETDIRRVISIWQAEYPETYRIFIEKLSIINLTLSDFFTAQRDENQELTEWFLEVYSHLTSGSSFQSTDSLRLVTFLEYIDKYLCDANLGIFFVYDEFGRFLQNIPTNELNSFMFLLQDLAEFANNGSNNTSILFISHKPFSHYFSLESRENRNEFAKVEKRFGVYEIKNDYGTFLKITSEFIEKELCQIDTRESYPLIQKFNVFSGVLNDTEIDNIVNKKLAPLHPIALYLLPYISKVFGQNERTLFTFLNDDSSHGLKGYVMKHPSKLYYPDFLLDYFFEGIDESYIEENRLFSIYRNNITTINSISSSLSERRNAERIFKVITLWSISHTSSHVLMTTEFIAYSTGISQKICESILRLLQKVKKVRYNEISRQWELFEGSPLDVEFTISKEKVQLTLIEYMGILEEVNPYRYVYSRRFNSHYQITRYAEIFFSFDNVQSSAFTEHSNDQKILIFINPNKDFHQFENETVITASVITDFEEIRKMIDRYVTLKKILITNAYIMNYVNLEKELEYEIMLCENYFNDFFSLLISNSLEYSYRKEKFSPVNIESIEEYLSKIFDLKYPYTLHINNDQINMFQITKIQENALVSVLHNIINREKDELDDIYIGSKPADLIYFSLIKFIDQIEENIFPLNKIKSVIEEHLILHPKGNLRDLIDLLTHEPFGTRPSVGAILLFSMMENTWRDIMFFINGAYIPNLPTRDLYEGLINKHSEMQYVFSVFDNSHRSYLEQLESIFFDSGENVKHKSLSIRVCSGMYNWYLNLPVITQQMIGLSFSDVQFLKTISEARIDPQTSLERLLNDFSIEEIQQFKYRIESHLTNYISSIYDRIQKRTGATNIREWALTLPKIKQKSNMLVNRIISQDNYIELYYEDVENLDISKWTKSSFDKLERLIITDFDEIFIDSDYASIIINGTEKHVKTVNLSPKAQTTMSNLVNTIDATKRYYSSSELEQIILDLVRIYIK